MDSDAILKQVLDHDNEIAINLSAIQLFVLISHLQVSQRYINGGSGAIARILIDEFIETLCAEIPEVRELIEMGNDPTLDVTKEYFDKEF